MSRSNSEKKLGAGRVVAVAIENNKTSQHAAKWAVDNLLPKDQSLYLIHVRQRASSNSTPAPDVKEEAVPDNESKELFESFRVFCNRKSIQCKEVLLEDTDISKAIVESISTYSIELMVLGAPARGGLVRLIYQDLSMDPDKNVSVADKKFLPQRQKYFCLNIIRFRATDVPSSVTKGAPPFCTVYIISKGKISSVKSASAPLSSNKSAPSHKQLQPQPVRNPDRSMDHPPTRNYPPRARSAAPLAPEKPAYGTSQVLDDVDIISPFTRPGRSMQKYESSIPADCDISFVSNGRPSIDRMFPSLYDDQDAGMVPPRFSSGGTDFESISIASSFSGSKSIDMSSPKDHDYSFSSSQVSGMLSSRVSSDSTDEMEAEMRRLKLELKQTMDMYSTACKEALTAKQKAMELQRWKLEEEKRMEEGKIAEEAAMTLVEKEKEKSRVALKAAEASQRIAVLEAQKRMNAEMRGQTESNTRKKTEDSFGANRYRRYTIEEIEEATKGLSDSLKIGEGGYGPVYRCELDHTQVAIKVLKPDAVQGREQFQQEVEVLSCIRHPNMVLLLGACPEYGCLVYEYMANGSLDDCLFRRGKSRALPWQLRFQIAAEIATGLLFLHQTKPEPLVHRDLKPGNVLLDRNYVSKISDVGLARLVPPSVADTVTQYRMTSTAGTFCYIDPEYQQTGMLGIKSDIYSLGIMLLQIVTAKPPMGLTHHVARSIEKGTFVDMLDPSVEDWPIEQTLHFAKLALKCAEMRRKDRPDLGKVVLPELNKLRAFAEENMPMMMMFGGTTGFTSSTTGFTSSTTGFTSSTTGFNSRSSTSSTGQDIRSESQTLSGISGYESRSSTSSLGRM